MITTSETTKEINTALAVAQKDIGFALKDTTNLFYKAKYADLASVWKAVQEPLGNNGLSVTQSPGVELLDGKLFVSVTTRLQHSSGEWICGTCYLPSLKHDPQSYGAAITYARRYSLAAFLGVVQDDDDAESAMNRVPVVQDKQEAKPEKKSKAQAPEKPGSKDLLKPGSPKDLKTRIKPLNSLMKELGAKGAEDCDLLLLHCCDGVVANPTWAEIKENPEVDVAGVEKSVRAWLNQNKHIEGDEVINTIKMMVNA